MRKREGVRVLVVDDDRQIAEICAHFIRKEGYPVETAHHRAGALEKIASAAPSILFLDVRLPDGNGMEMLREIKATRPALEVILITAHGNVEDAVACMKAGASDFVPKPFKKERLLAALEQSYRVVSLQAEVDRLQSELGRRHGLEGLVGQSSRMRKLFDQLSSAAQTNSTVFILGESGTGKDLIARAVHYGSPRARGPFVAVNCAALPADLFESELFGYRKGAFTGAGADSMGLFRAADGGTLFLDEVVEMPPSAQSKLLRALQERRVRPVGGTEELQVDVRIICATNRDPAREVERGAFRRDLFYRLGVITLTVPPLRDRREDIPLLVDHFLQKFNGQFKRQFRGVDPRALEILVSYPWEGNVRELENAIESAFALGRGPILGPGDLPAQVLRASERSLARSEGIVTLRESEKTLVEGALRTSKGNKAKASRILGITRKRLYNLIRRHALGRKG